MNTPAERIPQQIWILIASTFLIAVGFGLIVPVLPQFARSFGVGATAASVVVSAFAFFRLVAAPAGGRLVARLGERPVYLSGLLLVSGSTAATGFAQIYTQLLVFRGLGGIGSTMFTVSALAMIVRLAPPAIRGRVSAAWASTFLIGAILGPVLGGLLGGFGLRVPFLVYAGMLLLAALVVATFIPASGRPADDDGSALPPLSVREALGDSAYRAGLASAFANGWSNFGVRTAILPLFAAAVVSEEPWVDVGPSCWSGWRSAVWPPRPRAGPPCSCRFSCCRWSRGWGPVPSTRRSRPPWQTSWGGSGRADLPWRRTPWRRTPA